MDSVLKKLVSMIPYHKIKDPALAGSFSLIYGLDILFWPIF